MNVDADNELTGLVIGAAIAVHRELGPGLAEAVYEETLSAELSARGLRHECQFPMPLRYKGVLLDCGYRLDLWVERRLVVELKSVETLLPIHEAQLLTYLRLAPCELGLLMNFDVPVLRQGVRRRVWTADRTVPANDSANQPAASSRFEPLSGEVLAAAVEVHRTLGPGLLRSAYEESLCHELSVRGIAFEREKKLPVRFRDVEIAEGVDVPLLVSGELPVVCLSVSKISALDRARLLARVRQGNWPSGLLLNFNVPALYQGIRRVAYSAEKHHRGATDAERGN